MNELYTDNTQKVYPDTASECKFLLGGIGTGNVSVGSRGQLCDWEIFNSPGKGNFLPYTFFALWTLDKNGDSSAKVLESRIRPPYERSHGYFSGQLAGLPRFDSASMRGEYPFVRVELKDNTLPLEVAMEAFTPFIPLDAASSGYPGAIIRYRVKNLSDTERPVSIACSAANAVGFAGYDLFSNMMVKGSGNNEHRALDGIDGLHFTCPSLHEDDLAYGSMAIAAMNAKAEVKTSWLNGSWWDGAHEFWDDFSMDGHLRETDENNADAGALSGRSDMRVGSLAVMQNIPGNGECVFEFVLTWYFPNRPKAWLGHICPADNNKEEISKNFYSTIFSDAWDVAAKLVSGLPGLEKHSRNFHRALFSSTLPGYVIEALADNITVIRSTTCFRLADGTFLAWEGCFDKRGSCEGNCTHVWNYAQTLAFLFPELERDMRKTEFLTETDDAGNMAFRAMQVFGDPKWDMLPAADGQLGAVIRLYRDWMFSGDNAFLESLWGKAKKALDFAFGYWDEDGDFVLESRQHNTYDIEFYGPNSLTNSIFFTALVAGAKMAEALGDAEAAERYRSAAGSGAERMDDLLWGGDYYIQVIDDVNKYRYQYGEGCLSDQVLGQQLAHICGLGYILPKDHVKRAIKSVYEHNFRNGFESHENVQRVYALNDEKGLLLCSWPNGGRPKLPFVYSDEVWSGIEYQVAAHLIFEGELDKGLTIIKAVRERYDGFKRNPWNEVECGNHYARSLASWGVLIALSGYGYNMVNKTVSFNPLYSADDFSCFFSTGKSWGIYRRNKNPDGSITSGVETLYGDADIKIN